MNLIQNIMSLLYPDYDTENIPHEKMGNRELREEYQSPAHREMISVQATARLQISMSHPKRLDDAVEIIDKVVCGQAVVLNFEKTEPGITRRILDFLSGAALVAKSTVTRISEGSYIILPSNMRLDDATYNMLESWQDADLFSGRHKA